MKKMVKFERLNELIRVRVISNDKNNRHSFYISIEQIKSMIENKYEVIEQDIHSFCKISQSKNEIRFDFTWLVSINDTEVKGFCEKIEVYSTEFISWFWSDVKSIKMLDQDYVTIPKIIWLETRNLKRVVSIPKLRKKLSKVISSFKGWGSYVVHISSDYFNSNDFSFITYSKFGRKYMNGGIILHDDIDANKAYYQIHT